MKYFRMKSGIMRDKAGQLYKPFIETKDGEEIIKTEIEYIMRDEDKALIPCNEANADYVAYLNDKDKVVEDFDYEAEKARQLKAAEEKEEADEKEAIIQAELRAMAEERIKAREE